MVHITKYCPNCKKRVQSLGGQSDYLYGSPIRTCPYCFHNYIDKQYHEIAIDGVYPGHAKRITIIGIISLIMAVGMLGFTVYSTVFVGEPIKEYWAPLAWFVIMAGVPLYKILNYKKDMEDLEKERIASEKRMTKPDYLRKLQELGYSIPQKYMGILLQDKQREETKENAFAKIQTESCVVSPKVGTVIPLGTNRKIQIEAEDVSETPTEQAEKVGLYCRKCGARMPADSVFCPSCGEKVIR